MHPSAIIFAEIAALCTLALAAPVLAQPATSWVYVAGKDAISLFRLDAQSGELTPAGDAASIGAGFIAFAPNERFVYATGTVPDANKKPIGGILAFSIDRTSGKLTLLNGQPSQGDGPCFVTVDHEGKNVLATNYSSATVVVFPLAADGTLQPASCVIKQIGSGINRARQDHAYAHSVNLDPSGKFAFVADLGADKLFVYRFDSAAGKLTTSEPANMILPPGSGPRHLAFDPNGRFAYLINEMGASVAVYSFDAGSGSLKELQIIRTLPETFKGVNTSAEVLVHPSGKFVYASNRGDTNFITIFAVDKTAGTLSLIGYQLTLGKTPRNFRIDPTGRYLIAANQDSDSVVLFSIDQSTGLLKPTGKPLKAVRPTCVKFLPTTTP